MPPRVNKEECTGCGICLFECGASVFEFRIEDRKAFPIRAKECVHCFICQAECPQGAIKVSYPYRRRDEERAADHVTRGN